MTDIEHLAQQSADLERQSREAERNWFLCQGILIGLLIAQLTQYLTGAGS